MSEPMKLTTDYLELVDVIHCATMDWDDYMDECSETETPPIDSLEDFIADGVVSAGYRKLKWIPVTERLPEADGKRTTYGSTYAHSRRVLCACLQKDGKRMAKEGYCRIYNDGIVCWMIPGTIDSVTHWMELPSTEGLNEA